VVPRQQLHAEVAELYEEHAAGLLRYGAALARSEDLSCDAVQETFLRYFVERSCGRKIETPRAWLYQVLRNNLFDRLNAVTAAREVADDTLARMTDPATDPENLVRRHEMARDLAALLSVRERECLGLRAEGHSYTEIAAAMGLRIGTVGALLARAHEKIRRAAGNNRSEGRNVAGAVRHLFRGGIPCHSV